VTTWADAHARAAVMASELQADLDIELDQPVDVFDAIDQLGIVLAFAPLGPVSGMYLPGGSSSGILLHQGHPRTRQRYTAGHELGHHVFRHAAMQDVDLEAALRREDVERWPDHEKEAEAFGAWFLMPRRLVRHGLAELGIEKPSDPFDAYALSLWLGTSYTATARQLATTRIIDQATAEQWARIAPARLKQALAGELAPDDLRNDVWWIDARHHEHPVEARPGDRVVLTLPENASTGFSWHFTDLPDGVRLLADSFQGEWEPQLSLEEAEPQADGELVGAGSQRAFVLEVDPHAAAGVHQVALVKDQAWDNAPPSSQYELRVSIKPSLHGLQLREAELAIAAGSN
jgi:Zn-dependent peptidase ImmA (M78 family)/predicted secreted protein